MIPKPKGMKQLLASNLDEEALSQITDPILGVGAARLALVDLDGETFWSRSTTSDGGSNDRLQTSPEMIRTLLSQTFGGRRSAELPNQSRRTVYATPIILDEGPVGVLVGCWAMDDAPLPSNACVKRLLDSFASAIKHVFEARNTVAGVTAQLTEVYEELSLVYTLTDTLKITRNPEESLNMICDTAMETLRADLFVFQAPSLGIDKVIAVDGVRTGSWQALLERVSSRAIASGAALAINHIPADAELRTDESPFQHAVVAPMEIDGDLGSVAAFRLSQGDQFFAGDVQLLEAVARQTSVYLANRKMVSARRQLFDAYIFGLARLAESRDPDTRKHLDRVREYACLLANTLRKEGIYADQIDDELVENIYRCSPLHDIGKVGISDTILLKPDKLTREEFEVMKTHTVIGGDTLRDIEKHLEWRGDTFLSSGREIAYSHHEKWDGSGYPVGLKGEDIPLTARIVALADVYDALTSKRPYKQAFSHEKATGIILESSGTHFEPAIVKAFVKVHTQFDLVRDKLREDDAEIALAVVSARA